MYDEHGLLHLSCGTDDDCYAALGYFHASNRFFFMDFVRASVRGRLGAIVRAGALVLDRDFANRRFFSTREGEPLEQRLYDDASPVVQGYFDAYARGVNAWLDDMRSERHGATLTTEYDFALLEADVIREWEPADSAAVGLYILHDLSNKSAAELARAELLPHFDPALAADLFSARPVFDAFSLPSAKATAAPATAAARPAAPGRGVAGPSLLAAALGDQALVGSGRESQRPGESGSNNWVLAPARTANGRALLADDPHLALTNPSVWFPVELDAKSTGTGDFHVAGTTFPGLPAVILGHNEQIAWGLTTANWDLSDEYVETLSEDGASVRFQEEDVAIIEKELVFADSSTGEEVTRIARWVPHHGPIVAEDLETGTALSIRWVGHEGGTDLDGFFAVGRASSVEEAREGIALMSSASQSFVVADVDGHIGWYPYSRVPSRPWASAGLPPWLPVPGDGSAEWDGFLPLEELPQATDPARGAIFTANQDLTGASADGDVFNEGQLAFQAITRAEGTRARRILDELDAGGDDHTVASMHQLQGDTYSLYGEVLVPALLDAVEGAAISDDERALADALAGWSFTCPTGLDGSDPASSPDSDDEVESAEAIGCTAFHATLFAVAEVALGDDVAAASASAGVTLTIRDRSDIHLVVRALRDPGGIASGDALWDDVSTTEVETRDEILARGLALAAARLAGTGTPEAWRWGRLHTLELRSIFDAFGVDTYNAGPYAAPGGLYTVNVANPKRDLPLEGDPWDFGFTDGASVRFVVEVGPDRPHMALELPGGTDLHRESAFYNNLVEGWLRNEPVEMAFGPGAVDSPSVEVTLRP